MNIVCIQLRRVCLIYQPQLYSVCDIYKENYKHKNPWLNIFQSKIRHRLRKQKNRIRALCETQCLAHLGPLASVGSCLDSTRVH